MTARVAVLASGTGSNLQAIIDHFAALGESADAAVVLVASDRSAAGALNRARSHGIHAVALDAEQRAAGMAALLDTHGIETIALAGYLRFVPAAVTHRWRGRIVNVHPSLLPSFGGAGMYGRRVHEAAIAAGVRVSGVTVHFVDEEYDRGPIIAQWPVPVLPNDSPDTLARRVLAAEHAVYPPMVYAVARGRIALGDDGRVAGLPGPPEACAKFALVPADSPMEIPP